MEVWIHRRLCDMTADCDHWEPLMSLAALLGTRHRGHAGHWRGAIPVGIWDVSPFLVTEVNVETPGSRWAGLCKRLTLSTVRQGPPPWVGLGMEFFFKNLFKENNQVVKGGCQRCLPKHC